MTRSGTGPGSASSMPIARWIDRCCDASLSRLGLACSCLLASGVYSPSRSAPTSGFQVCTTTTTLAPAALLGRTTCFHKLECVKRAKARVSASTCAVSTLEFVPRRPHRLQAWPGQPPRFPRTRSDAAIFQPPSFPYSTSPKVSCGAIARAANAPRQRAKNPASTRIFRMLVSLVSFRF